MANFPKSENDVVGLAEAMVDGYTEYGEDFPGVTVLTLETALTEFKAARAAQESARGQAKIATTAKNDKFAALVDLMKNDLKISEVDTGDNPDKLSLIGWGPKSPGTPIVPPTAPTNLRSNQQGAGEVVLQWAKPEAGGAVRNYIVKRRDYDSAGQVGNWQIVNFFYDNLITLINQPRGIQMEYIVSASNAGGESPASNILPVIL